MLGEFLKGVRVAATGDILAGSTRIYGIHWSGPVAGGRVTIRDASVGGTIMIDFDTPAAVSSGYIDLAPFGVYFPTKPHCSALVAGTVLGIFYSPPQ
jgi:hypothetical protein